MNISESIDFFKDILDNTSEDESNASSGLMVAAASLIYEHTKM
jgi:hypothetical protein